MDRHQTLRVIRDKVIDTATISTFSNTAGLVSNIAVKSTTLNGATTIPSGTPTSIQYNFDPYITIPFLHSTSVDNTRLNIPYPGVYYVYCSVIWPSTALTAGNTFILSIYVNGGLFEDIDNLPVQTSGTYTIFTKGGWTELLKRGDYVEIFVTQDSGSSIDVTSTVNMWMVAATPSLLGAI